MLIRAAFLAIVISPLLFGQKKADPRNTFERILAVVPMTGAGTAADPRRPEFVPKPGTAPSRSGIIAFSYQLSDDGQWALCELVARDRAAFRALQADTRVKAFEKGKVPKEAIFAEFRKYKARFDPERLRVVAR